MGLLLSPLQVLSKRSENTPDTALQHFLPHFSAGIKARSLVLCSKHVCKIKTALLYFNTHHISLARDKFTSLDFRDVRIYVEFI